MGRIPPSPVARRLLRCVGVGTDKQKNKRPFHTDVLALIRQIELADGEPTLSDWAFIDHARRLLDAPPFQRTIIAQQLVSITAEIRQAYPMADRLIDQLSVLAAALFNEEPRRAIERLNPGVPPPASKPRRRAATSPLETSPPCITPAPALPILEEPSQG